LSPLQAFRESLKLITRRDRRILGLVTLTQMSTALLDLIGVLLIGVVAALSLSSVSSTTLPNSITSLLDVFGISYADPVPLAVELAAIAGVLFVAKSILNMFLTRRVLRFLANRQATVSGQLTRQLLSQPMLMVQRRSSQETAFALTFGTNQATLVILGLGTVTVSELTLLIVLAIGLLFVSPIVTIFSILFFAAVAWSLNRLFSGWAGELGLQASSADIESTASIQEAIKSYREITVSSRRRQYAAQIQDSRWRASSAQADLQFLNLVPKYVFESALIVGAGLLAASQFLTSDATKAVAIIAVFLAAGSRVVPSMLRLQGAALAVRAAAGLAAPTYALASDLREWEADEKSGRFRIDPLAPTLSLAELDQHNEAFVPTVSFEHVFFTYPGAREPAIKDLSFSLAAGQAMAIIGSTGAGKSTVADVLLGILDADEGRVLLGNHDPLQAVHEWAGAVAYVPQDVSIISATIRQNVALGMPLDEIDDDRVWEALTRAHLADFLQQGRDGLETIVGEHGVGLSGGQRQRLGLARALYTRPRFLVLDEATSALDAKTELGISETLLGLRGEVTSVTIAHRLATIKDCDVVAYLTDGQLSAIGSFEEVRRQIPDLNEQAHILGM